MMIIRKHSLLAAGLAFLLMLAACGGAPETAAPTPTQLPPTSAPASVPPTEGPPTAVPVQPTQVAPTTVPPTAVPPVPTELPPTVAPTAAPTGASQAQNWAEYDDPTPGKFTREDVDFIFPPGRGQDLVFQGCTGCHNWVPLVISGFDEGAWLQNKINHRERVSGLSDADYDFLYQYLIDTWPPERPIPDIIPQDLLDQWTSY